MGAKEQLEAMATNDPKKYAKRCMGKEWYDLLYNPNARKWKWERLAPKNRVITIGVQLDKNPRPGREYKIEHYEGVWWVIKTNFPFPERVWGI